MNILYASLSQNLIDEQDVESESKRHDEDDEDDGKLGDGVDDVVEHEDEDAEVGHVAEVLEGVQPGKGDEEGSSWPLPASLSFAARRLKLQAEVEDKHKGEEVEKPVNEIRETEVSRKHGLNQHGKSLFLVYLFFILINSEISMTIAMATVTKTAKRKPIKAAAF